jgi:predicted ATPase
VAVAPISADRLDDALQQLGTSELVFRRGTGPEAIYSFKHALVQDAAYQSLLKSKRQQLHARIAQVLEERFPEVVATQPELLAHHCTEGGLVEHAVDYWLAAGERALRASANVEGIKHLLQGLEVLKSLPETPERQRKELRFQTALGPALAATKGWTAPEVAQAYSRADELCQALSDSGERFKAVLGLWMYHAGRGENYRALELSDELFRLAEQQDDDELRLQAHHSVWGNITWHGEFTVSREHIEQGIAMYSPAKHGSHALIYGGHDPGVCGWVHGGVNLWFLGYPDQAAEHVCRSVLLAEEIAHPPSLGHALHFGLLCHQLRGDEATVRAWGERLAELAAEHGLGLYKATAIAAGGWVRANQGQAKSSLLELRQGLDGYTGLGFHEFEPYFKALLAKGHFDAGEAAIGLEVLEDAMRFAEESGVRFWNAELLRLKGVLLAHLLPDGGRREVEAFYREALAVAGRQQTRSLELRAATSLARLWRDQGKRTEAHDLLAPIYGWFTEGVDTPDLKEAKALLDEPCE